MMMIQYSAIFLLVNVCLVCGFYSRLQSSRRNFASQLSLQAKVSSENDVLKFLANSHLAVTFDGFNVENCTCVVSLDKDMSALFSSGVESAKKGFWKVYKETPQDELWTLEVLHFTLPDYMFLFELEEAALTWKGKVDVANKQILDGVVSGLKNRFVFFFPYAATMATFRANILLEGEPVPFIKITPVNLLQETPEDFQGPEDMVKYPNLFAPDFIKWFYEVEDALARGDEPPPRPKTYFIVPSSEEEGDSAAGEGSAMKSKKKGEAKKLGFDK